MAFIKYSQARFYVWDNQKKHSSSEKLETLAQGLSTTEFVRNHRSYLINIDKVKEIQRWFNGKLMMIMNDSAKTELSTSRAGADKLKQILGL